MTKESMQPEFKIINDAKNEPTVKRAQEFTGGPVEGLEMPNGDYLISNEEAFLRALPINREATEFVNGFPEHINKCTVQGPALLIKREARQNVFKLNHQGSIPA